MDDGGNMELFLLIEYFHLSIKKKLKTLITSLSLTDALYFVGPANRTQLGITCLA